MPLRACVIISLQWQNLSMRMRTFRGHHPGWSSSSPHASFPYPSTPPIIEACWQHQDQAPDRSQPALPDSPCHCGLLYTNAYVRVNKACCILYAAPQHTKCDCQRLFTTSMKYIRSIAILLCDEAFCSIQHWRQVYQAWVIKVDRKLLFPRPVCGDQPPVLLGDATSDSIQARYYCGLMPLLNRVSYARSYSLSSYLQYAYLNSQVAEQCNSALTRIKCSISQMKQVTLCLVSGFETWKPMHER